MKKFSTILLALTIILFFIGSCKKEENTPNPITIGNFYEGGYIFYIDNTGNHGLVAAPPITEVILPWGCAGSVVGNTYMQIGFGAANTQRIVAGCSAANGAAKYCNDLSSGGYDDWFLPSENELKELLLKLMDIDEVKIKVGQTEFWTSSEYINTPMYACVKGWNYVNNTTIISDTKARLYRVRAVRAF